MNASNSQTVESSTPVNNQRALPWATRRGILVAVGLIMYVVSFFLWAVEDFGWLASPERGYICAQVALFSPFNEDGRSLLHEKPIEYYSMLGSGLINPAFLFTFFLQLFRVRRSATIILSYLTILMMPLCWVVFRYERLYPREGHVLWIAGMLLTLFEMSRVQLNSPKELSA